MPPTEGGGGMTLLASDPLDPAAELRAVPEAFPADTVGGGGTTSCVPKSLPMILLTNDPLVAWVGGGGTTVGEDAPRLPLSRRRRSREESAEGGGATTEGAGRFSFALREASRSGAETGGGTTAALFICTRDGETSWLTDVGAGGITLLLRFGAARDWSRETRVDAGAITVEFNAGAARVRSRETLGAGAMMLESRRGATSGRSDGTVGAGGTTAALRAGAKRDLAAETFGAGGTMELRVRPPRD
jgi:hypothetical protein